ncbi:HAD family hydrolase [bacterium]|nr:HAD family hydrolase [bacterium]RQV96349.1 MAG: HAD family hydrolase [bacterium]
MEESNKILVFDFDGVIANSIHESFMTAVNTYIQVVPDHSLPISNPLTPDRVFEFEKKHADLYQKYLQAMPLGSRAEEYFVVFQMIEKDDFDQIRNQSHFTDYKITIPEEKRKNYDRGFYENRAILQKKDPQAWAKLIPPFTGVVEAIPALSNRFTLCIATSKDRSSINILLESYDLLDYFDAENILDKDFADSKREHLMRFHKDHHVPYSNMHFIDDKVLHLQSVKNLGVHTYLALWGFNDEREYETAREEGFILLSLDDLKNIGNG